MKFYKFFYLTSFLCSSPALYFAPLETLLCSTFLGYSSHFLAEAYGSRLGIHPEQLASTINEDLDHSRKKAVFTGSKDFLEIREKIMSSLYKKEPVIILIDHGTTGKAKILIDQTLKITLILSW